MFKYLKTIGAHSGAAEPEYLRVKTATTVKLGTLCEVSDGYLSNSYTAGKTKFVSLEGKEHDENKKFIKCLRVLPGMFFEVDFMGEVENIPAGTMVMPINDSDDNYYHCEEGSGRIEVIDSDCFATTNKIIVTIHD